MEDDELNQEKFIKSDQAVTNKGRGSRSKGNVETAEMLPELPGVDCDKGVKNVGGRITFYRKMLTMFYDKYHDFEKLFRDAQNDTDEEVAMRLAHSLKGLTGTLGADSLHGLALQLEMACLSEPDEVEVRLAEVLTELQPLIESISKQ